MQDEHDHNGTAALESSGTIFRKFRSPKDIPVTVLVTLVSYILGKVPELSKAAVLSNSHMPYLPTSFSSQSQFVDFIETLP